MALRVERRGAEGQIVEWIRDGDWFSLRVRDGADRATPMANAIYLGRPR